MLNSAVPNSTEQYGTVLNSTERYWTVLNITGQYCTYCATTCDSLCTGDHLWPHKPSSYIKRTFHNKLYKVLFPMETLADNECIFEESCQTWFCHSCVVWLPSTTKHQNAMKPILKVRSSDARHCHNPPPPVWRDACNVFSTIIIWFT